MVVTCMVTDGYMMGNHMLYHVACRATALDEIRRVLKSDGRFFAATNRLAHKRAIRKFLDVIEEGASENTAGEVFGLETGRPDLERRFAAVRVVFPFHGYPPEYLSTANRKSVRLAVFNE